MDHVFNYLFDLWTKSKAHLEYKNTSHGYDYLGNGFDRYFSLRAQDVTSPDAAIEEEHIDIHEPVDLSTSEQQWNVFW